MTKKICIGQCRHKQEKQTIKALKNAIKDGKKGDAFYLLALYNRNEETNYGRGWDGAGWYVISNSIESAKYILGELPTYIEIWEEEKEKES